MKTTIKYAHGKGFSRNLSSITVLSEPRTTQRIQANIKKAREAHSNREDPQLF